MILLYNVKLLITLWVMLSFSEFDFNRSVCIFDAYTYIRLGTYVTGFMKTVLIVTRNEIQFIADY